MEVLEDVLEERSSRTWREEAAEMEEGVEEVEADEGEAAWRREMVGMWRVDGGSAGPSVGGSPSSAESSSRPGSESDKESCSSS